MEENKEKQEKNQQPQPLTYEELKEKLADVYGNYQRLTVEYRKLMDTLNDKAFEYNAFFVNMLFKVIEHPGRFKEKFVKWASENIEGALLSFSENLLAAAKAANGDAEGNESKKEEKPADEAK